MKRITPRMPAVLAAGLTTIAVVSVRYSGGGNPPASIEFDGVPFDRTPERTRGNVRVYQHRRGKA